MVGHSAHDDATYVDKKLLEKWKQKDPILSLEKQLLENGVLTEEKIPKITAEIDEEIEKATKEALDSPTPDASWAGVSVFAE